MSQVHRNFKDELNIYFKEHGRLLEFLNAGDYENNIKVKLNMLKHEESWVVDQVNIEKQDNNSISNEATNIKALMEKNKVLEDVLKNRTEELKSILRELKSVQDTDYLTGLFNRRRFYEIFEEESERSRLYKNELTIIQCDIDYFKGINDKYGRKIGDEIICITSGILRSTLRRNDIFARFDGDAFVILLPDTDIKASIKLAEKLRIFINNSENKYNVPINMSFGVTECRTGENMDLVLNRLEIALNRAKANGRNRVELEL